MAPSELRVTITGAKHLKNVNWRAGELRPYAVLWLDPADKRATRVAVDIDSDDGGVDAKWDDATLTIPFPPSLPAADAVLHLDLVHAARPGEEVPKPLIGSAKLPIRDLLDDPSAAGAGAALPRSLKLKRPSGRPQGKVEVQVTVRDPRNYSAPPPAPAGYGYSYSAPPPQYGPGSGYQQYGSGSGSGYPQYAAAAGPDYRGGYGSGYGAPAQGYSQYQGGDQVKKGSKFGVGTGVAVGAAAGLVGGLALAEGVDYLEDEIADKAADKVEDDLGYGDDGGDDGGGWF